MRRIVFLSIVVALSLSLVTAVPVSAGPIKDIDITLADDRAGATTDYEIAFTPKTGEATTVSIDFSAFGTTGTDMILSAVSTNTSDYLFTGFSFNPTAVVVNDTTKIISFTGGTTTKDTEHTIINKVAGTGLVITNDQNAETKKVGVSTASDSGEFWLTINPGAIDHYSLSNVSSPQVAGTSIAVRIQAQDQYDNDITTGSDASENITISLGKADAGATPTSTTTTNGKVTVGMTMTIAQVGQTITFTGDISGKTGTSNAFDINPGAIDHYSVSAIGSPQAAGTSFGVTIQAQDVYNNDITTGTDGAENITISLGQPDAGVTPTSTNTTNGKATVGMTMTIAQVGQTITFTGDISGKTGTSNNFDVNPGALASFTISGTPATILAGAAFPSPANDITVTAFDAWGNVKTDYVGTVTWSSSAVATLPADYTFVLGDAGVHTFPGNQFRLNTAGTQTITVTDIAALVSATSSGIVVVVPWTAPPPPDTTPSIISDISASNITKTSADINWKTNEKSTSQVEYWSSPSLFSPIDKTLCYNHLVYLTDLTPGTTYHYRAMSMDSSGNLEVSNEHAFTTTGEAPAAAFSIGDLSISPSEVNIGETVTISVLVANIGNLTGSYEVTLKINDVVEATKEVTVDAGASEKVTFTTAKDLAGSYSVAVDGLSASFTLVTPAAFSVSNLSVQPAEAQPEEAVTITVSVANTGDTEGSYTVVLTINEVKEAQKSVTVAAGSSQDVSFTTIKEEAGGYNVAVDGLSGSFSVVALAKPPINWPAIGGIIAGVIAVGLLIFFLIRRKRKAT